MLNPEQTGPRATVRTASVGDNAVAEGLGPARQKMAQMRIDAQTRLVGILGDPVVQSLSPVMHNAAFAALEMNWRYVAFHVPSRALAAAIRGASALRLAGLNITVPHKVAAAALVDEVDPIAQQVGAINTVRIKSDRLDGFNTDVGGILDSLSIDGQTPIAGRACVVIGAGGGGRAAAFGLAGAGASRVTILNRTVSRARGLAQVVARAAPRCQVDAEELTPESVAHALEGATVLVHTSLETVSAALGGGGGRAEWVQNVGRTAHPGMVVLDMVYTPTWTELLRVAHTAGARAVSGLAMLVHQGGRSFELWTGRTAPRDVMRRAVGLDGPTQASGRSEP